MNKLSVIIPIRNQIISIELTLYWFSILFKENLRFDVIVVDDGSTEDISSVIKRYANQLDMVFSIPPFGWSKPQKCGNCSWEKTSRSYISLHRNSIFKCTYKRDWDELKLSLHDNLTEYLEGIVTDNVY